jgi:uncharacterized damage-inducible protein DinB
MFSTVQEFQEEWLQEAALTQKVLDALVDAALHQPVSAGGRTLGRIAWHIAMSVPQFLNRFGVPTPMVQEADGVPSSAQEIANTFRSVAANAATAVREHWTGVTLTQVQDFFGREAPNAVILSQLIKHIVHHRGQMTVLMRQAGLNVPGVYGPSKEEWSRLGQNPPAI